MKQKILQRRAFTAEMRVEGDGKKIVGHAAVFDQLSVPLWGFREKIRRGAFAKTIREADVRALFNHNADYVLGRNRSGTLKLTEDDAGLVMDIEPPDTQVARDLMTSIGRGDVDQASFQFYTIKDEWDQSDPKDQIRTLLEVELVDVSVVTFPAYPQTDVSARSLLSQAGIDYDRLAGIMLRSQRGIELQPADHDILKASIDLLRSFLPAEPDQADHSAEGPEAQPPQARRLSVLRKRLELIERAG